MTKRLFDRLRKVLLNGPDGASTKKAEERCRSDGSWVIEDARCSRAHRPPQRLDRLILWALTPHDESDAPRRPRLG